MKILVAVKQVVDPYVRIRVKADHSGVETAHLKKTMNPFDEIALEEALRLREAGRVDEIMIVSVGTKEVCETLRHGLALGADRAIWIEAEQALEPRLLAIILEKIVQQEQPQLVLMGKQAIDDDNNQTGQMLAGVLQWAQGTFVSKLTFVEDDVIEVMREVDAGIERLQLKLPAVLTTDLRLNEPRYASMPNIMRAKHKPLLTIPIADLAIDCTPRQTYLKIVPPRSRQRGQKLANVDELLAKLQPVIGSQS